MLEDSAHMIPFYKFETLPRRYAASNKDFMKDKNEPWKDIFIKVSKENISIPSKFSRDGSVVYSV